VTCARRCFAFHYLWEVLPVPHDHKIWGGVTGMARVHVMRSRVVRKMRMESLKLGLMWRSFSATSYATEKAGLSGAVASPEWQETLNAVVAASGSALVINWRQVRRGSAGGC
jgi:hypothetical protein